MSTLSRSIVLPARTRSAMVSSSFGSPTPVSVDVATHEEPGHILCASSTSSCCGQSALLITIITGPRAVALLLKPMAHNSSETRWSCSEELWAMGFNNSATARGPVIIVINKADCPQQLEVDEAQSMWPGSSCVATSTLTGVGLPKLEETIADLVLAGRTIERESVLITSARHQDAVR